MSSYEEYFMKILIKENIKFVREKTYNNLKKGKYRYDFYLPKQNILIEIDGQFHYEPIRGRAALNKQQEHDRQKNAFALANNIPLYRIPYWELDKIKTSKDFMKKEFLVRSQYHNDYLWYENRILNH